MAAVFLAGFFFGAARFGIQHTITTNCWLDALGFSRPAAK